MNYSEKDFQDYAAGSFNGNKEAFEKWMEEGEERKKLLKQYTTLFNELKKQPEQTLSINLEYAVMKKLQTRTIEKKESAGLLNGFLVGIGVAVVVICWLVINPLDMQLDMGLFIGSAVVTICFTCALHVLELTRKREKFRVFTGIVD